MDTFIPQVPINYFGRTGRRFALTPRDSAILKFLWRWKLASTATVHEAIGSDSTPYSTYKALERLESRKYVEAVMPIEHRFIAWQLTKTGFLAIRESLGGLCEEGYLSENPWHDRNVLAFHLGEWSKYQLSQVSLFTEQEMRRRHKDYYPEWVPDLAGHRPDGLTQITAGDKSTVLAIEVELSAKRQELYSPVISAYSSSRKFERVIWLVGNATIKSQIVKGKTAAADSSVNYHVFVNHEEFMYQGWAAPVTNERSQTLFTLRELYGNLCGQYRDLIANNKTNSSVANHYDPRKVLGKTSTC
jgi:hypothetical protein